MKWVVAQDYIFMPEDSQLPRTLNVVVKSPLKPEIIGKQTPQHLGEDKLKLIIKP
jgi:hypothetical protein